MKIQKLFIITFVLLLVCQALAQTEVEGDVEGVWTVDDSPYIVIDDIRVRNDDELVIDPGVRVLFDGPYTLWVNGWLSAVGTQDQMILFSPTSVTEGNKWRSIRFIRADDDCEISYCIIMFSEQVGRYNNPDSRGGAIYGSDCDDLIVSHNIFCYNSAPGEGGAVCFYNCTGEFSNNHVYDNYGFTEIVWFEASDMPVMNNIVENNEGDHGAGIFIAETSQLVSGNTIRFNESTIMQWGAALYFAYGSRSRVYNNLIYGNISGAIYLGVNCRITDFDRNVIFDNSRGPAITLFRRSHLEINNSVIWGHNQVVWMPDGGNSMEAQYSLVEDYEDEDIAIGEGMIDANPRFVDPDVGNFRLANNSPCIDAGDPDSPRDPDGTRADIGLVRFNFNELAVDDQTNGEALAPDEYTLSAPYPNPFNDRSQITFCLPEANEVRMELLNISGQLVKTLVNKRMATGSHTVSIHAQGLSSGVYWIRLTAGSRQMAKQVVLLR